jgi:hypothetical protein
MKISLYKILTTLVIVLLVQSIIAQAPQGLNYQAVARDAAGKLLDNQAITVRLTIIQGSATGTEVYAETHAKTTNQLGLFTLTIGQGTITAPGTAFNSIDWSTGNYWLQVELKMGGGSYTNMGTSQLLSVPFAFYADEAYNAKRFTLTGTSGQTLRHNGTTWVAATNLHNNGTNVGIGTTSPDDAKLEIYSNSTLTKPQLKLIENDADDFARLTFQNTSGVNYWSLAAKNSTTNSLERFNIYNSISGDVVSISGIGNVGIGITPESNRRLYVDGASLGACLFVNNSKYTNTLRAINSGSSAAGYFQNDGAEYTIYAKNIGTGPAAYFDGTLQVAGGNTSEINRSQTGSANIVPVCYGFVDRDGIKNLGGSTNNFTVYKVSTGIYEITITGETYSQNTHCAIASLGDPGFINTYPFSGKLRIVTSNTNATQTDKEFSFVIYRP